MSAATSEVAILGSRGNVRAPRALAETGQPVTRVVTFGALALYGTIKWGTLLMGHPLGRLLGLFAVAMLLAAGRPALARRSRVAAALATALALLAVFPIAGVPLAWVWHVRIAVTANAIGEGLSALPQVLVPYSGVNQWVDLVMTLGGAVLLFDGALLVAFAPRTMGTLRRAGAALSLTALAAVPTTLVRPQLPYVDGAILFGLLVAFMWGEQIGRRRTGGALGLGFVAIVVGMFLAPALDQHKPWFNYRALAGSLAPRVVDGFDWTQGYGRIDWPQKGRIVLEIAARRPEYWKAENLDVFGGVGWQQGPVPGPVPEPDPSAQSRWTQKIQVTVRDMETTEVIGAGESQEPEFVAESLSNGVSPGTWQTATPMVPGDAYDVTVYAPDPSAAELNAAGAHYSRLALGYRAILLPPSSGTPSPDENFFPEQTSNGFRSQKGYQAAVVFPPFHSGQPIRSAGGPSGLGGVALLDGADSVGGHSLGDAYRLAQSLAAGAATPYQFVVAVEDYLSHGFVYDPNPPTSSYPLVSFLFSSHKGYCQQFAGAMALLLRMGGVPARVAVGFTTGHRDQATGRWLVSDYDAHAWVEVWFPHYGWVKFDPTPAADPALSGHVPPAASGGTNLAATGAGLSAAKTVRGVGAPKRHGASGSLLGSAGRRHGGLSFEVPLLVTVVVVALLALIAVATRPLRSADAMVAELERALARIGRPVPGGATLARLERRVEASDDAAGYVRALRLARFRGSGRLPTGRERRALRHQLRRGLGPLGALRAIWALPPRWARPARFGGTHGRMQSRAPRASGA